MTGNAWAEADGRAMLRWLMLLAARARPERVAAQLRAFVAKAR